MNDQTDPPPVEKDARCCPLPFCKPVLTSGPPKKPVLSMASYRTTPRTTRQGLFQGLTRMARRMAMICGLGLGLIYPAQTMAESQSILESQAEILNNTTSPEAEKYGFKKGSIVVAPIPFSNPTVGSGLMLGAGYLFTTSKGSKPSMFGVGALRSDNGTSGYGASLNLAFSNNRWLFSSFFAKADARYDLYTPIGTLPIRQDGVLGRLGLSYGVNSKLSFGAALRYLDTSITPDTSKFSGLPAIPAPFSDFLNVEIASIGFVTDWDQRDDTIYPTRGSYLQFEAYQNVSLGGALLRDYQTAFLNFTKYFPLGQSGVLAARVSACAASPETPFFDLCSLGITDSFRGFSATQFIGQRSVSAQVEYRHQFTKRLGLAAFGGIGLVGPQFGALTDGGSHSAIGLGARYRVSKKFPLDFAVDVAHNNLGQDQLYIYVGQRF